jgi:hypothetical protein
MRALTIVLPHFVNLGMLAEQQRVWSDYPADDRARLHVVVVDDCSPKGYRPTAQAITASGLGSLHLYRIAKKVRWNWLACRNLGVHVAETDWVLLTDIDHVLPLETFREIVNEDLDTESVYRFGRVDAPHVWPYALADCKPYKPHPNTWLMTRKMYDRVGGYDERLSGCYGTDGEFRDRVQTASRAVIHLTDPLIRYPREIIPDASTTCYTRKGDARNDADLIQRRADRALIPDWRPLRLTFPWELVAEIKNEQIEVMS